MTNYYLHDGEKEHGPYSLEQLASKDLKKNTPIWFESLGGWRTVDEVEEVRHLVSVVTPPPLINANELNKVPEAKIELPIYKNPDLNKVNSKRSILIPILLIVLLSLTGISVWLYNQYSETNESIDHVEEKITASENHQSAAEQERLRINKAITEKNMNYRNNWQNYIHLSHDEPSVNYTFGGISSFSLHVNNETSYMLDEVEINIEYIRKNGDVYQTKSVSVFNIPAGASENGIAPSSINGVKVICTISKIISRKMHFCYPSDNGNSEDPYFYK